MQAAFRTVQKTWDFLVVNKVTILGLAGCYYMSKRMAGNIEELEKNTQDKKLFDPVKAKAQIEVYKEIYRMEENETLPPEKRVDIRKQDGALKILQSASDNDVDQIRQFFIKKGN